MIKWLKWKFFKLGLIMSFSIGYAYGRNPEKFKQFAEQLGGRVTGAKKTTRWRPGYETYMPNQSTRVKFKKYC